MTNTLPPMAPYALLGRIVTMDAAADVIDQGAIYIHDKSIAAVLDASAPAPAGFEGCPRINTSGSIYPGMIELHNHLSYNILPLWNVPKKYTNRDQWAGSVEKRQLISGPMSLLNDAGGYLAAIVRYVEAKCLLAGVTTSQGLTLVNAAGIEKKYRGIVRNVEEPDDDLLVKAGHKIADVSPDETDRESFLSALKKEKGCFLLHLSEGVDQAARQHFLNLELEDHSSWAITDALAGIHAAGLLPEDIAILKQFNGSMVWSPLSNLMLYGDTAKVKAAKDKGVLIALGSDWSPSGSKNLLGELKIAKLYSHLAGDLFSDLELARMVTSTPARILKWQDRLGSLETQKLADLFVVDGQQGDPYDGLLHSTEATIRLVVIGGMPRCGTPALMKQLGQNGETWPLAGQQRLLNLGGAPDADVSKLTLKQAQDNLKDGLFKLPNPPALLAAAALGAAMGIDAPAAHWQLDLDNDGDSGQASRSLAPLTTGTVIGEMWADAIDVHDLVKSIELDELTVAEDPQKYLDRITSQRNLPEPIKTGLPAFYGM